MGEFFGIDARFILGAIAIEEKEDQGPDDAQQCETIENPAPAPWVQDHNGEQRRDHDGEAAETMEYARDETALGFWKPKVPREAFRRAGTGLCPSQGAAEYETWRRA